MAENVIELADPKSDPDHFVSDVRSSFTSYFDATRTLRDDIYADEQMNKGGDGQWLETDLAKLRADKRSAQSFNIVAPIINFVAGYQREQWKDYRAFPRGTEDEQISRIMTGNMKYAMDLASGAHVLHHGFRRGIISGLSVIEVVHTFDLVDDLVEGEIQLNVIPELAWYCEPGARRYDRQDAAFMGKLMWYTPEDGKKRWPKHKSAFTRTNTNTDWTEQDQRLTGVPEHIFNELYDSKTGRVRVLQHWYRIPITVTLLINTMTGEVENMESEEEAENALRSIYDKAGKQAASQFQIIQTPAAAHLMNRATGQSHPFVNSQYAMQALDMVRQSAGKRAADQFEILSRPTTGLRVAHLTGWELLDDKPSPYGSDWRYPFVPFIAFQDSDDYGSIKGLIRDVRDPQREVNWHHATMLDTLVRGPKGGVWLPKGEHTDLEKIRRMIARPGFVGEYVGANPPVPVQPQVLSGADQAMLQFGVDMAMRISSVTAEMLGQVTQKTVSGRAIQSRQQGGLVGLSSMMGNWEQSCRLVGELLVRRIQQFYSVEKMQRVIGDEQRFAKQAGLFGQMVKPDALVYQAFQKSKDADIDVVVGFQEPSATARAVVAQQMLQFKAMGAPIPMELIIEASDLPFKEDIIAASKKNGEQAPNPALIQALGAGQGMQGPDGVNKT